MASPSSPVAVQRWALWDAVTSMLASAHWVVAHAGKVSLDSWRRDTDFLFVVDNVIPTLMPAFDKFSASFVADVDAARPWYVVFV